MKIPASSLDYTLRRGLCLEFGTDSDHVLRVEEVVNEHFVYLKVLLRLNLSTVVFIYHWLFVDRVELAYNCRVNGRLPDDGMFARGSAMCLLRTQDVGIIIVAVRFDSLNEWGVESSNILDLGRRCWVPF